MIEKNLVGKNEYKVLNEKDPIGYICDVDESFAVLIHRNDSVTLTTVEAIKDEIFIDNYVSLLSEDTNSINRVELFKGEKGNIGNLSILLFILHRLNLKCKLYNVFEDEQGKTSIGYNFNTKEHLMYMKDKKGPVLTMRSVK